ncbi:MAG: dihydroorotase [Opitutales bacterium]
MPDDTITLITNGRIIDPANQRDEADGEVRIRGDRIAETLTADERSRATVIDAAGQVICPGLVDIHVHLREPGQTQKENIETGSRAAAAGGFTTLVCMPNTSPVCDTAGTIRQILDAVRRTAVVHVYPTGCITKGMGGEEMAPIGSLKKEGVVAVTDDGKCVQSNELMRRILEYAHMFRMPVMDHCQDYTLTDGSVMNEGTVSLRLGLRGWPAAAEDIIVARNSVLSEYTGAHVHLQHISSGYSVDIIRRAKSRSVNVTAEASPHHLALTDEALADYDTHFKMNPPLRTEADRQALIAGLVDGTLDCICTDHAPHTDYEKDVEFDHAPFGIIGLETSLAVCLGVLVRGNHLGLSDLIAGMTCKPARLLGLEAGTLSPGAPGDVTVFDPEAVWTVDPDRFFSMARNSPWNGQTLAGKILHTVVGGRWIFDGTDIRT